MNYAMFDVFASIASQGFTEAPQGLCYANISSKSKHLLLIKSNLSQSRTTVLSHELWQINIEIMQLKETFMENIEN